MTKEQIENEFRNLTGINEAKKVFKKLAQVLHPDKGGSNEEFQELNSVYNYYLENKLYFSNESKFDLELEKIISKILHYEDITIEVVGSWIWLSGIGTKNIKDKLKELGFKWAKNKKKWFYGEMRGRNPTEKSFDEITAKYGVETIKTKEKGRLTA